MENYSKSSAVITVLVLVLIAASLMIWSNHNKEKKLKTEISKLETKKGNVERFNEKINNKQAQEDKRIGNIEVIQESEKFNKRYFDWATWGEFSNNMEYLKQKYPNLKNSNVIDISGKAVGNGDSPISSYSVKQYPTTHQGEIAEVLNQSKTTEDSEINVIWYKVQNYDKGKYSVTYFKPYEEIDYSS